MNYSKQAPKNIIDKTILALKANGITAEFVETADVAKAKVLSLIPKGAEVMTMTSITLEQTGIKDAINSSGKYNLVKNQLSAMDREKDSLKMQKIGAAPEWAIGSVHAVTKNGEVLVASNTGSQLPAYVYGSSHVVWVVGAQKIVKDIADGLKRIKEYIVPRESIRARKAYGLADTYHTNISKLLIVNKELNPERIKIIFVNQVLGF